MTVNGYNAQEPAGLSDHPTPQANTANLYSGRESRCIHRDQLAAL